MIKITFQYVKRSHKLKKMSVMLNQWCNVNDLKHSDCTECRFTYFFASKFYAAHNKLRYFF